MKNILIPFFGNVWFSPAIPPRYEGRIAIVTNVGWDAVDASSATDERGLFADGEAVWFWRPLAGVKFARRQRVAWMTGSTKQVVPEESAE